jgi:thioredoxin 1
MKSNHYPVDVDTFDELVIARSSAMLVLLDISAEWCGPCRVIEPILTRFAEEHPEIALATLEAEDENMKIAGRFGVRGFPTIIAFRDGEEVGRFHGAQPYAFIEQFVAEAMQ